MVHVVAGEEILASHMNAKLDADGSDYRATADFVPSVSDSYDLGSSGFKWKDLHISGKAYIDGGVDPTYIQLDPQTSEPDNLLNNKLWVDSADNNKLKFKDASGVNKYILLTDSNTQEYGYLPIHVIFPDDANPPTSGNIGLNPYVEFSKVAVQKAYFSFQVPADCDTTQDITVQLWYCMTTSYAGDVKLNFDSSAFDDGDNVNVAAQNSSTQTITAPSTQFRVDYVDSSTLKIPAALLGADKLVNCMIARDSTAQADTHTGNLRLLNIRLKYRRK